MYCYSNNGLSMRAVEPDYEVEAAEVLFHEPADAEQLAAAFSGYAKAVEAESVQQQIAALEATQTPRRIREAANGKDNGWLEKLDAQIAELRSRLGK